MISLPFSLPLLQELRGLEFSFGRTHFVGKEKERR